MMASVQNPNQGHQVVKVRTRRFYASKIQTMVAMFALLLIAACKQTAPVEIATTTDQIPFQSFKIDAEKGGVVMGENGGIFAIPAGAFTDSMGNAITGEIDFIIKEANTDQAIIRGGLITQTGNEMLATGGMYMVAAAQNGQQLKLNPELGIYASLPSQGRKDSQMGLYKGKFSDSKLDWKLTGQAERGIPRCDENKFTQKQCKKCQNLLKMTKRIKPGRKPAKNDYYTKRHYWENGVLYFASSGSKKPVLSQKQLDECKEYLEGTEKGRDLLATVDQYKAEWKNSIGGYYEYKLNELGWYNIDKLVKEELVTFKGKVLDEDGQPMAKAQVHLYCKDQDLKVHVSTTAEDGSFELKFSPGRNVVLYAFESGKVGKTSFYVRGQDSSETPSISLAQADPENVEAFFNNLL